MEAILILAGGSGTRLWPLSSKERPKQFLSFGLDRSFLQFAVERGLAVNPTAEVVIVTSDTYCEETSAQVEAYKKSGATITVIGEPEGKNTGPAILLGALYLRKKVFPSARLLVLSADHLIHPIEAFVQDVKKAASLGGRGWITVFGIPPESPHTGYGYIERGEAEGEGFRVKAFKEKPNAERAKEYVASGNYYWNSGMFLFPLDALYREYEKHASQIVEPFKKKGLWEGVTLDQIKKYLVEVYQQVPSISVDYAILEKSDRVAMVETNFAWNDVGSWDEVARLLPPESPSTIEVKAKNNYVNSDIPVALCGVEDVIVVIRDGKALIMKKGTSQLVRDIVAKVAP
ncbi:MAG: mannose-1-phosphate guanylyltransferase [Spirochaetales bacterium]